MKEEKKYFLYLIIAVLVATNLMTYVKLINNEKEAESEILGFIDTSIIKEEVEISAEVKPEVQDDKFIYVHVSGDVVNPGLVRIKSGKRVKDAIDLAGGVFDTADLSRVNLAKVVQDEEKIHIPKLGEEITESMNFIISNSESNTSNSLVNINTASEAELQTLPGIGPATAKKIISHREKNRFEVIEDLMDVSGIGTKKFEAVKDLIKTK